MYFHFWNAFPRTSLELCRVTREVVRGLVAGGCWVVEGRLCPQIHMEEGLGEEKALEAVWKGL